MKRTGTAGILLAIGMTACSSSGTSDTTSGSSGGSTGASSTGSSGGSSGTTGLPACTITVPANLPAALAAPGTATPYLQLLGAGTQNYKCGVVSDGGTAWAAAVPEANLYFCGDGGAQVGTHFGGPTWQWTADGSTFVGDKPNSVKANSPDDAVNDVPWLLLPRLGGSDGGKLGNTLFAQRVNTQGGNLRTTDVCDTAAATAGTVVKINYSATYIFYR